jgi:hypothetical protein
LIISTFAKLDLLATLFLMNETHHTDPNHHHPYTEGYYPDLLNVMRVGIVALAWRHSWKHAAVGTAIGLTGQLTTSEKKATELKVGCCGSLDYAEVLAGGPLHDLAKLVIPTLFVIAHLDKRLMGCCGDIESLLMSAVVTTYVWHKEADHQ